MRGRWGISYLEKSVGCFTGADVKSDCKEKGMLTVNVNCISTLINCKQIVKPHNKESFRVWIFRIKN